MAGFIAKQLVGDKVSAVTGGGDEKKKEMTESDEEAELDAIKAKEEEEERRKDKHRKMEEERERMRQGIRDKYQIKKREDAPVMEEVAEGGIGRSKAKDPNAPASALPGTGGDDESMIPKNLDDLKLKLSNGVAGVQGKVGQAKEQCSLQ